MKIRPIAAAAAEFAGWYDVYRRARLVEYPQGPTWLQRELAVIYEPTRWFDSRLWVAESDGAVVGAAGMTLPLSDNLERADVDVSVVPEAWRRGIGSALLDEAVVAARAAGRRILMSWLEGPTGLDTTAATAFAAAHGFTPRLQEIARAQRAPFDLETAAALEEDARRRASAYRIVQWRDRAPDDLVDELARLNQRMSTDAPVGELDFAEEAWDADRVRSAESRRARMGRQSFATAALAADGTMAGVTDVVVATDSDATAFQDLTIVDPRHRGHRLGLLMKAANLRLVLGDRPGIESIWTWNAESNRFMIGVNELLGYRVEGWSSGYQLDLPDAT